MAGNNLGQLFYTLGLDSSDFEDKIKSLAKKVKDYEGAVNVDSSSVTDALSKVESLSAAVADLKKHGAEITIGGSNGLSSAVKPTLSEEEANNIKAQIEKALVGVKITGVDPSAIETAIKGSEGKGHVVTLTCNRNSVAPLIGELNKILNNHKVWVKIFPTVPKAELNRLKNDIENKIKEVKLRGVTLEIAKKSEVQAKLNAITGLTLPVEIQLHTSTLKSQLDSIKSGITLTNDNLGGGKGNGTQNVKEQNDLLSKQLGIRRSINDQMSRNTQLATMLGNVMGNVFATYQIKNFLENLIQVGGEIQKQRMALEHILQSSSKSDTIFAQMKDLAVKSPFGLQDLMQNARQLSAFGIQYADLFDTMKRLSDVAAGLGIQFGRLSLAYGETLERGFLDGKLVRQFAYMGLPVLQKVADYYTEIGKAGKGVKVTAAEVREMVSNRMVSFEDVSAVIKKMTDEGGQFANMQEVMAESVAGKWKNVSDAVEVMYSNMVEGNSEFLKAPAEILITLTRNYDQLMVAIGAVTAMMVGSRMATKFYNAEMGNAVAAAWNKEMADRKLAQTEARRAAILGIATKEQKAMLVSTKGLTDAELQELAIKNNLSAADKKRLILHNALITGGKNMNKETLVTLMRMRLLSAETIKQTTSTNFLVAGWARANVGLAILRGNIKLATMEFRMMAAAMLSNPLTWIFAAITAAVSLGTAISNAKKKAEELRDAIDQALSEKMETAMKVSMSIEITSDMTFDDVQNQIDAVIQEIKNSMPELAEDVNKIMAVDENGNWAIPDIKDRLKALKELTENYAKWTEQAQQINTANLFDTDGLQRKSTKYAEELQRAYAKVIDVIGKTGVKYYRGKEKTPADIAEYILGNPEGIAERAKEYWKMLGEELKNDDELAKVQNELQQTFFSLDFWNFPYNNAMDSFKQELEKKMGYVFGTNVDWNNLTAAQQSVLKIMIDTEIEKSEDSDFIKDLKKKNWYQAFTLGGKVEFNDYSKQLDGWKKELDDLTGHKYTVDIQASSNINDAVEMLQKKYKESKDKIEQAKPILIKAGIDLSLFSKGIAAVKTFLDGLKEGTVLKDAAKVMADASDEAKVIENASKTLGFNLEKTTTKKSGSSEKKEDKALKEWKEQFDELKKAYSEYSKWEAKVGKERAGKEIESRGLISKKVLDAYGLDIKNFGDAKSYKDAVQKFYDKIKSQLKGTDREKFDLSIKAVLSDIDLSIEEEALKRANERVEREINGAAKQYDMWKVWFDATGDSDLALQMAKSVTAIWDSSTSEMAGMLEDKLGKAYADLDWSKNASMIDMQKLFDGKGLSAEFKVYKDIYTKIYQNGYEYQKKAANVAKEMLTYEEKLVLLEKERLDAVTGANGNQELISKINARYESKVAELDPEYKRFMSSVTTMTEESAQAMGNAIKMRLLNELSTGAKSIEEYAKAVEQVDSQLDKSAKRIKSAGEAWLLGKQSEYVKTQYNNAVYNEATARKIADAAAKRLSKAQVEMDANPENEFYLVELMQAEKENTRAQKDLEDAVKDLEKATKEKTKLEKEEEDAAKMGAIYNKFSAAVSAFQTIGESLSSVLGENNFFSTVAKAGSTISQTASALKTVGETFGGAKGSMLGTAIGTVIGGVTSFLDYNQNRRESASQDYQNQAKAYDKMADVLKSSLEKKLGGVYSYKISDVKKATGENSRNQDNNDKATIGNNRASQYNYFQAQQALLSEQITALEKSELEVSSMKGDHEGELADIKAEVAGLKQELEYLAEDMMKDLYGIDFKDWASQLGDALVDAWARGEDGAKAYADTVKDLIKSVTKSVVSQSIIETALQPVLDKFKKAFTSNGAQLNTEMINELSSDINKVSPEIVDAVNQLLNNLKGMGTDLSDTSESSSTSNSIKGISEETADILAAYINGMRLDLSLQRLAVERIANAVAPEDMVDLETQENVRKLAAKFCDSGEEGEEDTGTIIARSQLQQLEMIASNTQRNAEAAEAMRETLDAVVAGTKSWSIQ